MEQYSRKRQLSSMVGLLLIVFITLAGQWSWAADVQGVRLWRAPDHTRLVFDLTGPVDHKVFSLENPNRLVIDINQSKMLADFKDLSLSDSPIKKLRHGARNGQDLRVVLDVRESLKPRSFLLKKHAGKPDRLVVDLYSVDRVATKKTPKTVAQSSSKRDIIIAIDAGHGGEDPGAIGPNKIQEKHIVLAVSRELEKIINAQPGYKAILTRDGDYYLAHKLRRDRAREKKADLFISIHADAFTNPKAKGASVFALSNKGATSETARLLATKENNADLIGGVGEVDISDMDEYLAKVIVDLSMTETLVDSLDVGGRVLHQIGGVTRLHKRHVEQANFLVLKSPDVPSILVETGFISNPTEARKLNTRSHRQKLANAIFNGVQEYFYAMPPADSYVAWLKNNNKSVTYTIARGDTLSGIAKKYQTSVAKIKQANKLTDNAIKVGQSLTIPAS